MRIVVVGHERALRSLRGADRIIASEMREAAALSARAYEEALQREAPGRVRNYVFADTKRRRRFSGREVVNTVQVSLGVERAPDWVKFTLEGTRPHVIFPRRKKALWWEGARHPVKRVFHPGASPNPFIDRAARLAEPEVRAIWADIESRIADRLNVG